MGSVIVLVTERVVFAFVVTLKKIKTAEMQELRVQWLGREALRSDPAAIRRREDRKGAKEN